MPETKDEVALRVTREELLVAMVYLRAPAMVGVDSTFLDDLTDNEQKLLLAAAERSLLAHGVLEMADNREKLELQPAVRVILSTCAVPEHTFLLTIQRGAPSIPMIEVYSVHANGAYLVMHIQPYAGIHNFIMLEDQDAIAPGLMLSLGLKVDTAANSDSSIRVPESIIERIRDLNDYDAIINILTETNNDKAALSEFAQSFENLVSRQTLAGINHQNDQSDGFSLLEGQNGLWLLRPVENDSDLVEITPINGNEIQMRVSELVHKQLTT